MIWKLGLGVGRGPLGMGNAGSGVPGRLKGRGSRRMGGRAGTDLVRGARVLFREHSCPRLRRLQLLSRDANEWWLGAQGQQC